MTLLRDAADFDLGVEHGAAAVLAAWGLLGGCRVSGQARARGPA
jgi:hypothetical protein